MEVCCSLKTIAGGICGADSRYPSDRVQLVPLISCTNDIVSHKSAFSFIGPENEVDLILSRAGIFHQPAEIDSMVICPLHRKKLGLGWNRGANIRCTIPSEISNHGRKSKKHWPKGERGVGKYESELLLQNTGLFIQVGSGNSQLLKIH